MDDIVADTPEKENAKFENFLGISQIQNAIHLKRALQIDDELPTIDKTNTKMDSYLGLEDEPDLIGMSSPLLFFAYNPT